MSSSMPTIRSTFPAFQHMAPRTVDALREIGQEVKAAGLGDELLELVKVRASQVNACAFCLQFHLNAARAHGVPGRKLDLLAVWREVELFDGRERAALAWTERLTRLPLDPEDAKDDWQAINRWFSEEEATALTVAIAQINAWNRIGAGLNFPPPPERQQED